VPLQKAQYKAAKNAATANPQNDGNAKIIIVPSKLAVTEHINENFLPIVSANTDVGSSNRKIRNVEILDKE